ncbi:MAG TPA: hypothetical protein VLA43_15370 [Longimicrobiales bacterium]|nr:hypothetical protein [Longimicrobiales bacterium]
MCTSRFGRLAVLALVAALAFPPPLHAQGKWSASLFGGAGLPMGDFGDDAGEAAGLANPGFVLGSELAMSLRSVPGLDWLSTLQGVAFGVDESFLEELLPGAQVDLGRYLGAMALTGLRLRVREAGTRIHLAGQLLVGVMRAPSGTFSGAGERVELESGWEPVKGLSGGVGAAFGERITVEGRYVHLINPEVSAELTSQGVVLEEFQGEQPMSWIQVVLAVRVW